MPNSSDLDALQPGLRWQIHEAARDFESALAKSSSVQLTRFLPPPDHPARALFVQELVKVELEFRWKRGWRTLLEDCLAKYPELGPPESWPAQLVYNEYLVRQLHGDRPSVESYRRRFPGQFGILEQLLSTQPVATVKAGQTPSAPVGAPTASIMLTPEGFLNIGGGYRLLQRIGRGQFGEVWRAESVGGGFEVGIKLIFRTSEEAVDQEKAALEVIKGVRHPFLLSTQSYWFLDDRLYIVMELADGSLSDWQKENRPSRPPVFPPPQELVRYVKEAAEALDYLHQQQVMHRDIKPANLLLLQGHIKVADFGLAKVLEHQASRTATMGGTPAYMAPEVWHERVSINSDQYSLAVTYAELRLGRRPFRSSNLAQAMNEHLQSAPNLEGMAPAEEAVVAKALAKRPEDRHVSCLEFAAELERAVAPPPPLPPPPPSWWLKVARLAAFGALLMLIGYFLLPRPQPPDVNPTATLPPGCQEDPPGSNDLTQDYSKAYYHKQITKSVGDGELIVFVLVAQKHPQDVPSFYIMRDKVSNKLYKAFVTAMAKEGVKVRSDWEKGGIKAGGADPDVGNGDDLPVLRVSAVDAHRFALWLGGLLPRDREWDRASGNKKEFNDTEELKEVEHLLGPFGDKKGKGIAVNRLMRGPMPLTEDTDDVSHFGCRHMSGNGLEWTDSLVMLAGRAEISKQLKANFTPQDVKEWVAKDPSRSVWLRGWRYTEENALHFADMEQPNDPKAAPIWNEDKGEPRVDPEIGFRVVIHPPAVSAP
jgi:serine/threonine protein kinase